MSYYQDYQGSYYGYNPAQSYGYDASAQPQPQAYAYAQPTWPQQPAPQPHQPPPQAQQQQQPQHQQQRFNRHHKAKNPRDTVSIHCDICELNCLGQDAYNAHMVGRKHAAAAKRKAAAEATSERYSPYPTGGHGGVNTGNVATSSAIGAGGVQQKAVSGKYYCSLCGIYSTDLNTFNLHLNGRKHLAMAQQTGQQQPPTAPIPQPQQQPQQTQQQPQPQQLQQPQQIQQPQQLQQPQQVQQPQLQHLQQPQAPPATNLAPPSFPSAPIPIHTAPSLPPTPSSPSITSSVPVSPTPVPAPISLAPTVPPPLTITPPMSQSPPSTPSPSGKNQNRPGPFRRGFNNRGGGGGGGGGYGRYGNKNMHVNAMPLGKNTNVNFNNRAQAVAPTNAPRSPPSTLSMAPTNTIEDNMLASKHAELSPSAASAMALAALVRTISNKLSELGKKASEDGVEVKQQVVVSETKLVGSYAKGTMLKGNLCADIVAITQAPPTYATLEVLYNALMASVPDAKVTLHKENAQIHVQENDYNTHIMVTWLGAWRAIKREETTTISEVVAPMDTQGTTMTTTTTVTAITTTTTVVSTGDPTITPETKMQEILDLNQPTVAEPTENVPQPQPNTEDTLDDVNIEACQKALLSIRQMMWFNEHSMSPNIRSVMRLVLDFRSRNEIFQVLTPWTMEIIVAHALRTNPPNSSISQSLRSVFAYMASGVLLPGIELIDPCQQESVNVLASLSAEERLSVTALAQELIRDIAYGKWDRVVGTIS